MNSRSGSSRRPESIKEALQMLDEALLSGESRINEFISGTFSSDTTETLRSATESLQEFGTKAMNAITDLSERGIEGAIDGGREAIQFVDSSLRRNPWPIIGGVALGALLVGIAMGNERNPRRGRRPYSGYRH